MPTYEVRRRTVLTFSVVTAANETEARCLARDAWQQDAAIAALAADVTLRPNHDPADAALDSRSDSRKNGGIVIPNADMIEKWATETDDGFVKIPQSGFPELLWVLRQAEKIEGLTVVARSLIEAHDKRAKDARFPTPNERLALDEIRWLLEGLDKSRSFAS